LAKPRLLVIERDSPGASTARQHLGDFFEIVTARTMSRALYLLREQDFAGVYVDASQLSAVRWAGVLIQADEILDAIAEGVAVVDPDLKVLWTNPEFQEFVEPGMPAIRKCWDRTLARSRRRSRARDPQAPRFASGRTATCG
jgi:PAS domain-containing protein